MKHGGLGLKTNRVGSWACGSNRTQGYIKGVTLISFLSPISFSLYLFPLSKRLLSPSVFSGEFMTNRRATQNPVRVPAVAGRPSRRRHHAGTLKRYFFLVLNPLLTLYPILLTKFSENKPVSLDLKIEMKKLPSLCVCLCSVRIRIGRVCCV